MRILFFTDNFPPESNAPATRTYEHAAHWVAMGHDVSVITCAPNFPEGRIYPGYKNRLLYREYIDGIEVVRVKTLIFPNKGFLLRTLDYLSFGLMSFFVGLFERKPDIVVATSPQFFAVCGGYLTAKLRQIPWVFELRDIWPASIAAVEAVKAPRIMSILERLELFLYAEANKIVCVSPSFVDDLAHRGVPISKMVTILNGVNLSLFKPLGSKDVELSQRLGLKDKFVVGYIGTQGMAHALENVVHAASRVRDSRVAFLFVGSGAMSEKLQLHAESMSLSNVYFVSRQPKEMMPRYWSLCDVSLISLKNTPLFEKVIPSKIFESMAMGLPMVASCPKGEATRLLESDGAGLHVAPEDPDALANMIESLAAGDLTLREMSSRSKEAALQYDRSRFAEDMIKVFQSALT